MNGWCVLSLSRRTGKSLERRITRRKARRVANIETLAGDTFSKGSDIAAAIIAAELTGRKITEGIIQSGIEYTKNPVTGELREVRRPIRGREERTPQAVSGSRVERPVTQITDEIDYEITDRKMFIDSKTRGTVNEILIRSPSSDFACTVIIDGIMQFSRTYSEFVVLSPQSNLIDAFIDSQDSSVYVLHIDKMSWRQGCQVIVIARSEPITFNNIFINLEEFLI